MQFTTVDVRIQGTSPMTQSRNHGEARLASEKGAAGADAYDARTWRSKLNTEMRNGKPTIVIPAFGMHQCISSAARYSKTQIPGQGKATWTAKFNSGLMFMDAPSLNMDPAAATMIAISAHSDGKRGSGSRVTRRFPKIEPGWTATFSVTILDPIITETVFSEMLTLAGLFIGVGQFRPENGGSNGRFVIDRMNWREQALAA